MSSWRLGAGGAKATNTMKQCNVPNSEVRAEAAASKPHRIIKLGIDVHAATLVVARIVDDSAPQPPQTFTPARFAEWVKTQLALADTVHSCYEAGAMGFVLHRRLVALGVKNVVTQPVCLDEQHKKVNHDKSDALALAQRLDRYATGNSKALATVRVPSEAEEQRRIESRQREQLKGAVLRAPRSFTPRLICDHSTKCGSAHGQRREVGNEIPAATFDGIHRGTTSPGHST